MRKISLTIVAALALSACQPDPSPVSGDFAVLAQAAEGYAQARPGQPLQFPLDLRAILGPQVHVVRRLFVLGRRRGPVGELGRCRGL